jgi:Protein of unknown function (DUF2934)
MMNMVKHRRVEERAYAIWNAQGRPHGRHEEHWHLAEREIAAEEAAARPVRRRVAAKPRAAAATRAPRRARARAS